MARLNIIQKIKAGPSYIIFLNGQPPPLSLAKKLVASSRAVLACDGAANYLATWPFVVNYLVGDFDSISQHNYDKFAQSASLVHRPSQNHTDLAKALDYIFYDLISEHDSQIVIHLLGGVGDRFDHIFHNWQLLSKIPTEKAIVLFWGINELIFVVDRCFDLQGLSFSRLSFFGFSQAEGVTTFGLQFNEHNKDYDVHSTGSISNSILTDKAAVDFSAGRLLVFLEHSKIFF